MTVVKKSDLISSYWYKYVTPQEEPNINEPISALKIVSFESKNFINDL
jgi:hypothetical protein